MLCLTHQAAYGFRAVLSSSCIASVTSHVLTPVDPNARHASAAPNRALPTNGEEGGTANETLNQALARELIDGSFQQQESTSALALPSEAMVRVALSQSADRIMLSGSFLTAKRRYIVRYYHRHDALVRVYLQSDLQQIRLDLR